MDWEITIHSDQKYVEIVTKGALDRDGSLEMAKEISKTMRRNRIKRALIDHRNISDVSGEVIDIYERPKIFRIIGVILGIKVAEVINLDHLKHFRFLETVCLNQGFKFSIFHERRNALEWLLS